MKGDAAKAGLPNGASQAKGLLPSSEEKMEERGQWSNKIEFILSVAGSIIGLGNMWRFPYLCYKNGGGAFLIPYLIFLFACGVPVFFLEIALGQYTSEGGITCWRKISPLFEGLGYGTQVIVTLLNFYYIIVLAWGIFYLSFSFSWDLAWSSCNNTWNTENCVEIQRRNNQTIDLNATSPVIEFWERRALRISPGIDHMGSLNWDLALCLFIAWVMCYFCIWKGVKSTGKVVYFTATFPYLMLIVLLIRGLTLPGAGIGIKFYLYPDLGRLADPQVWMDAGTQIFFSYAICIGSLTALGSYNKYNNNCYRDCLSLCFLNSGTSFVAGFAIFSIPGFSCLMNRMFPSQKWLNPGGMYVFQLFDYYAASGMCLLFMAIFETVCIAWVYGADRFYDNIEDMIGYRPGPYIKYCWLFFTPATCIGTFAFSLIKYTPLKYNNEYVYPWWGYVIGWLLALSSMVCIPLWMVYKISTTQGTLKERIQLLITPSDKLPKTKREQERLLAIFAPGGDANLTTNGYYPVSERDSNL
ncbi:Sodium- and chloride-dependent GABA transporter 2 [Larimichthys crocea]|uniref:Uncharacterized protein n=1 Tax=Larimichthys crocea TaxID=215358 RepID=A0ACD3Q7D3_LARCR|nr:Sodium- and chloride-dependent GABA transporter 2 [Larimichthys crocea]